MSFMAPDFMIIFLVSSAEDTQIQRSGPFKNTGRTYSLAPPYGWGRDLTGQRSLAGLIQMCGSPPTFPTTHTHTHAHSRTACFKAGGRRRVSISGKLPKEASGGW